MKQREEKLTQYEKEVIKTFRQRPEVLKLFRVVYSIPEERRSEAINTAIRLLNVAGKGAEHGKVKGGIQAAQ